MRFVPLALADELANRAVQEDPAECDQVDDERSRQKRRGRRRLPKDLQREILRHELTDQERKCPCCGELRCEIGVESSEQLEYIPARWRVIQHDRVKYACRLCEENVAIADKPPQPIEKGLPAPGLCAERA